MPCRGGTASNVTGLTNEQLCVPVKVGFWAPLGSAVPEPCPASGFFCPGAADDKEHFGSKPIIMPVGSSAVKKEVAVVEKEMSVDISIDDFNEQREAMIAALAKQYGVDPSLIKLEAAAGSLQIRIVIATSTGSAQEVLLEAVDAIDDAALGTALGTVLGNESLIISSTPPQQTTEERTVEFKCPRGQWCTAGLIVDCPIGTYNPLEGQDFATACIRCPDYATTLNHSATNITECVCQEGFVQRADADGNAKCECDAGYEIVNGVRCAPCGKGTFKELIQNGKCSDCPVDDTTTARDGASSESECVCRASFFAKRNISSGSFNCLACPDNTICDEIGVTLDALPVAAQHWRQSADSYEVRQCFTGEACLGGPNVTRQCNQTQTGPYCALCSPGHFGGGDGALCQV